MLETMIIISPSRRGILHKTIDCLQDLHDRCSKNVTRNHELSMLFNLDDWKQGKLLLCEDLNRKLGKVSLSWLGQRQQSR